MKAGTLSHRIELQRPEEVQDPQTGAVDLVWGKYATQRAARYYPLRVRERLAAAAVHSEQTGEFRVRYDPAITPDMRVIHRGKAYAILGVMPDPDSGLEYMTIAVSEGVIFDGR